MHCHRGRPSNRRAVEVGWHPHPLRIWSGQWGKGDCATNRPVHLPPGHIRLGHQPRRELLVRGQKQGGRTCEVGNPHHQRQYHCVYVPFTTFQVLVFLMFIFQFVFWQRDIREVLTLFVYVFSFACYNLIAQIILKNKQAKGIINGLTNCCCHGKQIGRAINNESNCNLMVLFYRINIFQ